jgi:uncharacterized protein (TIGR03083 family)
MKVELERFLDLLDMLDPADWSKPTACTQWSVREIVAHQAGGYASGTSYREMIRQYSAIPKRGQLVEDVINSRQVSERASRSPQELIQELHRVGPIAIKKWAYQFRAIKPVTLPHPVGGMLSLRHLMWVIHSRDTWMHRLDICRATGREFEQSAAQDGRIIALILVDAAKKLRKYLSGKAILVELSGIAGGAWKVGQGEPNAVIQMDALDFSIFASGRSSYEEARSMASLSGEIELADTMLRDLLILF